MPYLKLLRPKQWTKNFLVFAALLFTGSFDQSPYLTRALAAFLGMCLLSSSIYVFNDLKDVEKDRAHPRKSKRPLASGKAKAGPAAVMAILCCVLGMGVFVWLGEKSLIVVGVYLALQLFYNFAAKSVPILDVFVISSGFVLRAALGAAAIDVKISAWLLLCTGALALMLGFAKRRHEFILQGEKRHESRASLAHYNRASLDALVLMSSCAAALSYSIYALQSPTAKKYPGLILTALFVFYGICRYVFLIFSADEGGEPESILFRDPHMVVSVILFVIAALLAVKGLHMPLLDL